MLLLRFQFCWSLIVTSVGCLDEYLGDDTESNTEDGRHEEMIEVCGDRPEGDEHGGEAVPRLDGGQLLHRVDVGVDCVESLDSRGINTDWCS